MWRKQKTDELLKQSLSVMEMGQVRRGFGLVRFRFPVLEESRVRPDGMAQK